MFKYAAVCFMLLTSAAFAETPQDYQKRVEECVRRNAGSFQQTYSGQLYQICSGANRNITRDRRAY